MYFVLNGRGARRGTGVFPNWNGDGGARFVWIGVSGAYVKGFEKEAEAWERMQLTVPGVDSYEKQRLWWMSIPDSETNLSPTYSEYDGVIHHGAGAVGYTYTEHDDEEMALARRAATLRVTGEEDGVIDKRSYYEVFDVEAALAAATAPTDDEANDKMEQEEQEGGQEEKTAEADEEAEMTGNQDSESDKKAPEESEIEPEDDDYGNLPNSQEHETGFTNKDMASDSPPKKRKVESSPPTGPHVYQVVFPLPKIGATLSDVHNYLNGFQPGFGQRYEQQTKLCSCRLFPHYVCALVDCGHEEEMDEMMAFVKATKYLDKYVLESATITCNLYQGLCAMDIIANSHMEKMSGEPLVQHVKRQVRLQDEDELIAFLANCTKSEEVIEMYMKLWRVDENSKQSGFAYVPDKAMYAELEKADQAFKKLRRSFIPGDNELEVPRGFFDRIEYF